MTEENSHWVRKMEQNREQNKPAPGSLFTTGEKALVTGLYMSDGHSDGGNCFATLSERHAFLAEGDAFPSHTNCGDRVNWRLVRRTVG